MNDTALAIIATLACLLYVGQAGRPGKGNINRKRNAMKEHAEGMRHLSELCRRSIELLKDTTGLTEDNDDSIDVVIDNLREVAQGLMKLRQEAQDLYEQIEMMQLVAQVRDIPDEDRDVMGGHLFILRDVKDKLRNVRVMASLAEHRVRYWL